MSQSRKIALAALALAVGAPGPILAQPRNVVFILTDDHRYDAMGFMGHPFVETPQLDRSPRDGVHFKNAFVTTALCSPSRASILTGLYAHQHKVVDNNTPDAGRDDVLSRSTCSAAGYQTAFIGKWHMGGDGDAPQPGFDHWVSFRGQGTLPADRRRAERRRRRRSRRRATSPTSSPTTRSTG